MFVGLFEDAESSSDDDSELLEPKQEHTKISSCCQGTGVIGRPIKFKSDRDDIQALPQGIDGLVGSAVEPMQSLDEILGYKTISMELNELDVEPGTLGDSGMSEWEESFTDLFPSLMAV